MGKEQKLKGNCDLPREDFLSFHGSFCGHQSLGKGEQGCLGGGLQGKPGWYPGPVLCIQPLLVRTLFTS